MNDHTSEPEAPEPETLDLYGSDFFRVKPQLFICVDITDKALKRLQDPHPKMFGIQITKSSDGTPIATWDTSKTRDFLKRFRVLTYAKRKGNFEDLKPIEDFLDIAETLPITELDITTQ